MHKVSFLLSILHSIKNATLYTVSDPNLPTGCSVYHADNGTVNLHFNSLTTRSDKVVLNNGTKTFLLKYGFNPKFFRKYYLKGDNSIIPFKGKLREPKFNVIKEIELLINKLKIILINIKF